VPFGFAAGLAYDLPAAGGGRYKNRWTSGPNSVKPIISEGMEFDPTGLILRACDFLRGLSINGAIPVSSGA